MVSRKSEAKVVAQARPSGTVGASISSVAKAYESLTYRIIGAAMTVHNALGPGLPEVHYQRALSLEMEAAGLAYEEEKPYQVTLDDSQVGLLYVDHLVEETVVVEEKAFPHLMTNDDLAQMLTYLAVSEAPLGLLINFGRKALQYKRILPPKKFGDARARAARYAWRPSEVKSTHPLIRSSSAGRSAGGGAL